MVNDSYIIRLAVCAKHATDDDMHVSFRIIQEHATDVLTEYRRQRSERQSVSIESLESATKRTSATNLEESNPVTEETIEPEILPETQVTPTIYPTTKTRVSNVNHEEKTKHDYRYV